MQTFRRKRLVAIGMLTSVGSVITASPTDAAPATDEQQICTADRVQLSSAEALEYSNLDSEEQAAAVLAWMENEMQMSLEPALESQGIVPDYSCMDPPYKCPATTKCPWLAFGGASCNVTSCGTGSCPICPSIFPGLIVISWCAYGCMRGAKVVGGAFMIQSRFGWLGPVCIPA